MVKIAIAGGAGNVAQEIIDVLVATNKHEITILTRRDPPVEVPITTVKWVKTNYSSVAELTETLRGTHTVLSFIAPHLDQDEAITVQKNLIDASMQAGVQRFAPSEWVSARFDNMSWYAYKSAAREYLAELNKDKKVLEYCLFQPGLFTNYLTAPHKSAKHLTMFTTPFDYANRRMLMVDGGDKDEITLITVQDLAKVVTRAVEFEGEWPVDGGMGGKVTIGEILAMGERVRGGKFDVTKLQVDGLKNGMVDSEWIPRAEHPSIAPEHVEAASKVITSGIMLAIRDGAFASNETWNGLLPDFEFEKPETFLEREWKGKP